MIRTTLLASLLLCILHVHAQQYPVVTIPGTEVRRITSQKVAGQEYELQVLLPGGYRSSDKKYPVLYLMDAQWDFPLAKSLYGQHYYDGFIPEMIIVGVTWGGTHPNPDSLRARDYTPTNETRLPQSGGAKAFISFLQTELFPFVESNYKADKKDRTLMGCSLGGLFTMYTLFTHPELFSGYIAASPAYGWDKEVLYRYEQQYHDRKIGHKARLYLTMGEVERGLPGFEKFVRHLQSRNYPNISIRSKVLENTGHSGTKTEGFGRGMQFVFEKPDLPMEYNTMYSDTGRYRTEAGETFDLVVESGRMVCYVNKGNRFTLFYDGAGYYAKSEFFNLRVERAGGAVPRLMIRRYGKSDTAIREMRR